MHARAPCGEGQDVTVTLTGPDGGEPFTVVEANDRGGGEYGFEILPSG